MRTRHTQSQWVEVSGPVDGELGCEYVGVYGRVEGRQACGRSVYRSYGASGVLDGQQWLFYEEDTSPVEGVGTWRFSCDECEVGFPMIAVGNPWILSSARVPDGLGPEWRHGDMIRSDVIDGMVIQAVSEAKLGEWLQERAAKLALASPWLEIHGVGDGQPGYEYVGVYGRVEGRQTSCGLSVYRSCGASGALDGKQWLWFAPIHRGAWNMSENEDDIGNYGALVVESGALVPENIEEQWYYYGNEHDDKIEEMKVEEALEEYVSCVATLSCLTEASEWRKVHVRDTTLKAGDIPALCGESHARVVVRGRLVREDEPVPEFCTPHTTLHLARFPTKRAEQRQEGLQQNLREENTRWWPYWQEAEQSLKAEHMCGHQQLNIRIVDMQADHTVHFRIRLTTVLRKLFHAFCERQGYDLCHMAFLYLGKLLRLDHTALDLGLADEHTLVDPVDAADYKIAFHAHRAPATLPPTVRSPQHLTWEAFNRLRSIPAPGERCVDPSRPLLCVWKRHDSALLRMLDCSAGTRSKVGNAAQQLQNWYRYGWYDTRPERCFYAPRNDLKDTAGTAYWSELEYPQGASPRLMLLSLRAEFVDPKTNTLRTTPSVHDEEACPCTGMAEPDLDLHRSCTTLELAAYNAAMKASGARGDHRSWQRYTHELPIPGDIAVDQELAVTFTPSEPLAPRRWYAIALLHGCTRTDSRLAPEVDCLIPFRTLDTPCSLDELNLCLHLVAAGRATPTDCQEAMWLVRIGRLADNVVEMIMRAAFTLRT